MKEIYLTTEAHRRYQKKYYESHREEIKERNKVYKEKNIEKVRAYQKRYDMTHDRTEYFRQYNLKRKQMRLAAEGSTT